MARHDRGPTAHPLLSVEPGIPIGLALERARTVRDVRYALELDLRTEGPIGGRVTIAFTRVGPHAPLALDFAPRSSSERPPTAVVNGRPAALDVANGHLLVPDDALVAGANRIDLTFEAGEAPLHRSSSGMYSLFVPARAHETFPCFDQPDLKARFTLALTIPTAWTAVSNGAVASERRVEGGTAIAFGETPPLPTYLFAFAAAPFLVERIERDGHGYRVFHLEADKARVAHNLDAIVGWHATARRWLEAYTALPCPFDAFDMVLLPAFQFAGMEHPGAIYYNAEALLLDSSCTEDQLLRRASLIAHETTHLWFGDLVTHRWFDDVWMKEAFANLLAARIVESAYPGVNHRLRFLLAHYPAACSVDRSEGTHPIRQRLENLCDAGTLYGPIVYQKGPLAMADLENRLGPEAFREGVRRWLARFAFANADWPDLRDTLAPASADDLVAWSRVWIGGSGLPVIAEPFDLPSGRLRYGRYTLDDRTRATLLAELPSLRDPVAKGAGWIVLWEEVLEGQVAAADFLHTALRAVAQEDIEQIVHLVLGYMREAFWRLLSPTERAALAPDVEQTLQAGWTRPVSATLRRTFTSAFRNVVTTPAGVALLERIWRDPMPAGAPEVSEADAIAIACELALRREPHADEVLGTQRSRIVDSERRARLEFVAPALSPRAEERARFFASLADPANRTREPWVIEAAGWLHHPLRSDASLDLIGPSLGLLEELQRTGDIFLPKRWLDATLGGHRSAEAAAIVREFLDGQPDYPLPLRRIVLQSADMLFRAVRLARPR